MLQFLENLGSPKIRTMPDYPMIWQSANIKGNPSSVEGVLQQERLKHLDLTLCLVLHVTNSLVLQKAAQKNDMLKSKSHRTNDPITTQPLSHPNNNVHMVKTED